ncbi:MAG: hypothetical protein QME83_05455 [Thermodesulfobacteriota bacterium]|nr:hypothetical protein [Thermodesulfobacteriota bacterium]
MSFFNSISIRIPLAFIGGILYGLLTYAIVLTLNFPAQIAIGAGLLVFFLYLGSRLLVLFSGIDTPYYSKERKGSPYENTAFYQTAQWVGKFYHYHDAVLFAFLVILAIVFVISLIIDGIENRPFGQTIQDLWNKLTPLS